MNKNRQLLDCLSRLFDQYKDETGRIVVDDNFNRVVAQTIETCQPPERVAETKDVSILMSDLRGFTAMAENHHPLIVLELLNRYFSKMSKVINKNNGIIDKFMGDSIMVLFGALEKNKEDLHNTLVCAIEMQLAMNEINKFSQTQGIDKLYMGIGINSGEVVTGTLGSEIYREFTVIGDQVNLASRLEAQSLRGQILLSEHSYNLARDFIEVGDVNEIQVKGKIRPVKMCELLAVTQPIRLEVPCRDVRKSPRVEVSIPLNYYKLQGKRVLSESHIGSITDISYGGFSALIEQPLTPYSDIKMTLSLSLMGRGTSDIYARVLNCKRKRSIYETHLEFTAIDDRARKAIKSYVDGHVL